VYTTGTDTTPSDNTYQYTGRENDQNGLYYYRNRFLLPGVGAFASEDPMGFAAGQNLDLYVGANPINRIDPSGLAWYYQQSSGILSYQPPDSLGGGPPQQVSQGYSGNGDGLNNPAAQGEPFTGPIPQGTYNIGDPTNTVGPLTLPLTPTGDTNTYGRNNFRIHGDNSCQCYSGSEGCIILPRPARQKIVDSGDPTLIVVP
jgi:RHS repeat-associated protein